LAGFGFKGEAAEAAYQAGQTPARALGVVVAPLLFLGWRMLFTVLDGVLVLILRACLLLIFMLFFWAPLIFKLLTSRKVVKHRGSVDMICTLLTAYILLSAAFSLPGVISTAHAITMANIDFSTFQVITIPLFWIHLLRPSPRQISAVCTTLSGMFGLLRYYNETFDTLGSATLAAFVYNAMLLLMAFICEFTNRVSFVHQLSAVHYADTAMRQSEATRRSEASASQAINHGAKRVMYDTVNWTDHIRDSIIPVIMGKVPEDGVKQLHGVIDYIQTECQEGCEKCRSALLLQAIATRTYVPRDDPVNLRTLVGDNLGTHPDLTWTVSKAVPERVMLPVVVLKILMDNAAHNATAHGEKRGPLTLTVDAAPAASQAGGCPTMMLSIRLRNNPGKFHNQALKLQAEKGPNFLFRDDVSRSTSPRSGASRAPFSGERRCARPRQQWMHRSTCSLWVGRSPTPSFRSPQSCGLVP